jgi:dihydrofolate reductase
MAKLIYSMLMSLDGYIADEDGNFDWAEPDEEVHAFVNELERPVGTYLYGRRMYEVMQYWEALPLEDEPAHIRDYAEIWRAADKVVYSKSLKTPSSERTRIERDFDPEAVRELKASTDRDMTIGGPDLAAQAIRAGLVDEWHLFLTPVIVGGGNPALPSDVHVSLELVDERRFGNGTAYLRYRTRTRAVSLPEDRAAAHA